MKQLSKIIAPLLMLLALPGILQAASYEIRLPTGSKAAIQGDAPPQPTGFSVSTYNYEKATLYWAAPSEVEVSESYQIFGGTDPDQLQLLTTIDNTLAGSYIFENLSVNRWYFKIRSVNDFSSSEFTAVESGYSAHPKGYSIGGGIVVTLGSATGTPGYHVMVDTGLSRSYTQAIAYCSDLNVSGNGGWILPSTSFYNYLIDLDPSLNESFPNLNYWTVNTNGANAAYAIRKPTKTLYSLSRTNNVRFACRSFVPFE